MICHDCSWEADSGNKNPHECVTPGCTCQHKLENGVYINHDAVSKSKKNFEDEGATVSADSTSKSK